VCFSGSGYFLKKSHHFRNRSGQLVLTQVVFNIGPSQAKIATTISRQDQGNMKAPFLRILNYLRRLIDEEDNLDLVEYALILALIAYGTIAVMGFLANGIGTAFSGVDSTLTSKE
jgi:Flp pilus assembly pilin Flp